MCRHAGSDPVTTVIVKIGEKVEEKVTVKERQREKNPGRGSQVHTTLPIISPILPNTTPFGYFTRYLNITHVNLDHRLSMTGGQAIPKHPKRIGMNWDRYLV